MAYKALYRKYRPDTFDEVVGQQSVVSTILNAINNNKLAHAYLFCGPRGTGKTTIAKLIAKAINCESEGNKPCGCCSNCIGIQESSNPDVIELDAATNNGVDEVREIIEKVKYAPMNGKYKVYIIDEVHMMTSSAFNALLKTLEEPPEYCIFILATTEPHKVLPTIISRCQRFDFKKIPNQVIAGRLRQICDKEKVNCSDEAIALIAELADGGMRDSLSILDQCIAYAQNDISVDDVSAVYGVASTREKIALFDCVRNKEAKEVASKVNEISVRGLDVQRLTIDLINLAKECVIYAYSNDASILSILSVSQVKTMLEKFSTTQLLKYIDYLIETQDRYREANNALTYFEVCLLKMMDYQSEVKVVERVIEKVVEKPVVEDKKSEVKNTVIFEEKEEVNNFNPKAIPEYYRLDDEQFYQILINANKIMKEEDRSALLNNSFEPKDANQNDLINIIKSAEIMASSRDHIIFTVANRDVANAVNELNNKAQIEGMLNKHLRDEKKIIAVTTDEKMYLINYFKAHQNTAKKQEEVVTKSVEMQSKPLEDTQELRMIDMFGKDGFDIVEE